MRAQRGYKFQQKRNSFRQRQRIQLKAVPFDVLIRYIFFLLVVFFVVALAKLPPFQALSMCTKKKQTEKTFTRSMCRFRRQFIYTFCPLAVLVCGSRPFLRICQYLQFYLFRLKSGFMCVILEIEGLFFLIKYI